MLHTVHDILLVLRDSLPTNSLPWLLLQRITCVKYPKHSKNDFDLWGLSPDMGKRKESYLS